RAGHAAGLVAADVGADGVGDAGAFSDVRRRVTRHAGRELVDELSELLADRLLARLELARLGASVDLVAEVRRVEGRRATIDVVLAERFGALREHALEEHRRRHLVGVGVLRENRKDELRGSLAQLVTKSFEALESDAFILARDRAELLAIDAEIG